MCPRCLVRFAMVSGITWLWMLSPTSIRTCWPARRYFPVSGVALPVLRWTFCDRYLLRHWQGFSHQNRDTFVREVYRELQAHEYLMPPRMTVVMRNMVHNDWFGAYENLTTLGYALDRVARRIRFPNHFEGIIEEIRINDAELESRFLTFFPQLQNFAREV
jgi:acyl carrier protein phosphodiesterase